MSKTFPVADSRFKFVVMSLVIVAIVAGYALKLLQYQPLPQVRKATPISAKAEVEKAAVSVAVPEDWRSKALSGGVVSYTLSAGDRAALEYDSVNDLNPEHHQDPWLDGTRYPYVSEVAIADLKQDSDQPHRYRWNGVWQGEGYSRRKGKWR
jgi:hypothetical protein